MKDGKVLKLDAYVDARTLGVQLGLVKLPKPAKAPAAMAPAKRAAPMKK